MIEIQTRCRECPRITRTDVDEMQLEKYLQREGLVQALFPDYNQSQREAIMGYRGGYYLCPVCWDKTFPEEEENDSVSSPSG